MVSHSEVTTEGMTSFSLDPMRIGILAPFVGGHLRRKQVLGHHADLTRERANIAPDVRAEVKHFLRKWIGNWVLLVDVPMSLQNLVGDDCSLGMYAEMGYMLDEGLTIERLSVHQESYC